MSILDLYGGSTRPNLDFGKNLWWQNGLNLKMNNLAQKPPLAPKLPTDPSINLSPMATPFTSAMSGTQTGTLQPYINHLTQQGSDALYGGLLNYQPQSMQAGDAGGVPQNSSAPQFNLPVEQNGLLGGFGKRSWMGG